MTENSVRETWTLWLRWVGANTVGELLGLGATFAAIGLITSQLEDQGGVVVVLVLFAAAVATGAIEATVVGLAQWWAMRPWFRGITRGAWWRATLIGALVAYALGYLPTTLMSLNESATGAAPMAEPPQAVVLLLAAALGAVAGSVLAVAQWRLLRRHVTQAGRWLWANAAAWMAGMPMIFRGMDVAFATGSTIEAVLMVAATLFLAGAVVGGIHGAVLASLAQTADGPHSGEV